MCDRQLNSGMSPIEGAHQLIGPDEIKREPAIKDEPVSVGDFQEIPAFDCGNDAHPQLLVDCSQFDIGDYSAWPANDDVKIEVKEENDRMNGRHSLANNENANTNGNGNRENAPRHPVDRHNTAQRNPNESFKANARGVLSTQHQCGQCGYVAKYKSYLTRHLVKHTGDKPFPCDRCAKSFVSNRHLKDHMKFHVNEFLFHCSICLKGFDQEMEKMEHESNCKIIRYECHVCRKSFGPLKYNLTNHMCVHSGEKSFECTDCSKQFRRKDYFKRHLIIHVGSQSFHCQKCHKRFSRGDELIAHEQRCNRRMYECYVCGKFIGLSKGDSERHMRTHTGDKPFECTQCLKKFTQKSTLNDHMKIHSRSLPWKCVICRQGFAKQSQWKAHQRNCTRRVYECHLCKKFIGSKRTNLKSHMRTHSGEKSF